MTILTTIMALLSAIMVLICVPRIYGSWLQFKTYAEEGNIDELISQQALHNEWVIRNLCIALVTLGFVAVLKYLPDMEIFSQTAAATAIYSVISFMLAFAESIMAQKISTYTATLLQPVKERHSGHHHK